MSNRRRLNILDTQEGDIVFEQQQAADIGSAMGNGAASFSTTANPGVAPMGESGNLSVQTAQPGSNPTTPSVDQVMAVYTAPAGILDAPGRVLQITAAGGALNASTKTIKIIVNATNPVVGQTVSGGTTIASVTGTAAGGWALAADIVKYGANGSNTQQAVHSAAQLGSAIGALLAPSALTLNEAAPINIVVTCNDATVGDVSFGDLQVQGQN